MADWRKFRGDICKGDKHALDNNYHSAGPVGFRFRLCTRGGRKSNSYPSGHCGHRACAAIGPRAKGHLTFLGTA